MFAATLLPLGSMTAPTSAVRFEDLVLPEVDVLYRVARSLTRNKADAEDLVQDTLIRAYNAIDRFDGRYPRAWVLTILRNLHRNRLRRAAKIQFDSIDVNPVEPVAGPGRGRPEDVVDVTYDARVQAALDSLAEPFRQTVELVDLGGLSYAEAASVLGVRVGTIMSRLHRGRTRIRAHLEASGIVGWGDRC